MCRGFWVGYGATLRYCQRTLLTGEDSSLWALVLAEFVTYTGEFLLLSAFSDWTLWFLPWKMRQLLRAADLSAALGDEGVEDLRKMLDHLDSVTWAAVPAAQQNRSHRDVNHSPGRDTAGSGDFVFYDPYHHEQISLDQLRERNYAAYSKFADLASA